MYVLSMEKHKLGLVTSTCIVLQCTVARLYYSSHLSVTQTNNFIKLWAHLHDVGSQLAKIIVKVM
jgi:hypothetical protein